MTRRPDIPIAELIAFAILAVVFLILP